MCVLVLAAAWAWGATPPVFAGDLDVLGDERGGLLHRYLMAELDSRFEQQRAEREQALRSPAALRAYQAKLKASFAAAIGGLPAKTPLNPLVTGRIDRGVYVIERVAFESRPHHHVTANFYLPKRDGPVPGVLVPCGHTQNGKASPAYQQLCMLLAQHGIAALIVDPICQGERLQVVDSGRELLPLSATTGHSLLDNGLMMLGLDAAVWELWDNVRAVDYLVIRKEVDPARIGLTGNSGGGTQSLYLMAMEPRIGPAAPSCFLCSQQSILHSPIGEQDGCQQLSGDTAGGLEHVSFAVMRAPRPTRLLAAEHDFFPIHATRESFGYLERVYQVLDEPERVDLFVAADEHGFSKPRREAAVQWMKRWLLGDDAPVVEPESEVLPDEELYVTATGQAVSHFADEQTVTDVLLGSAERLAPQRQDLWRAPRLADQQQKLTKLLGLRPVGSVSLVERGEVDHDGRRITKVLIERPHEPPVPGLLFLPSDLEAGARRPGVVYVHGDGKQADAAPAGAIDALADRGRVVLAIDVRGVGETVDLAHQNKRRYGGSSNYSAGMLSLHLGRPLLGQRVEDVLAAVEALRGVEQVDRGPIDLVGIGVGGPVALHAALLSDRVGRVSTRDAIDSFARDVVARADQYDLIDHVVPGALHWYDLPDIRRALGERYSPEAP
ncbi:Acetyl xylan esterase (AXE1) [Pirellulimonas nuda]|uniref:Acetyl xylan esterase (AXE1) n=1 Tax=Pirellulimonas nuda TaxID=2528009 RepID=A0A518DDX7_9BACT|nr:acetylxylan esterase [Pirellulimonas nuda]QDU89685.1 Acetyl xylan esterase (AXE1) [Pirellulimonas nuda]